MSGFPITWAVKLIDTLHMLYGSRFMQQWDGVDKPRLAQFWAERLDGYTGDEIKVGLDACDGLEWPPSLPEFMALCRPWLKPDVAHHIAVDGFSARSRGADFDWPHPSIYWAGVRVGVHDLLTTPYARIKMRWDSAFNDCLSEELEPIPVVAAPLPAPERGETSEKVMSMVNETLKSMSNPDRNPRRWAWKILNEPEGKAHIAVRKAKECLIEYEPTELRQWVNEHRDTPGRRGEIAKELENES